MGLKEQPGYLVSVDPATKASGIATFEKTGRVGARLEYCGLIRGKGLRNTIEEILLYSAYPLFSRRFENVAVEVPRVYPSSKADPMDLIQLAVCSGAFASALLAPNGSLWMPTPQMWKGQLPKTALERRVRSRLSLYELNTLEMCLEKIPKSLQHNAIEAVGIGLKHEGRL